MTFLLLFETPSVVLVKHCRMGSTSVVAIGTADFFFCLFPCVLQFCIASLFAAHLMIRHVVLCLKGLFSPFAPHSSIAPCEVASFHTLGCFAQLKQIRQFYCVLSLSATMALSSAGDQSIQHTPCMQGCFF